jgi:hypothetical protein
MTLGLVGLAGANWGVSSAVRVNVASSFRPAIVCNLRTGRPNVEQIHYRDRLQWPILDDGGVFSLQHVRAYLLGVVVAAIVVAGVAAVGGAPVRSLGGASQMRAIDLDEAPGSGMPNENHATVRLVRNRERFDFYIEAGPGFTDDQLAAAFRRARRYGLVAVEMDPEQLDENDRALAEGTPIRLWLEPTDSDEAAENPLY